MTTEASLLNITTENGVQVWSMNFAPANALHPNLLGVLNTAIDDATRDEGVSVVILTSELGLFSSGGDAKWMRGQLEELGTDGLVNAFNETMDAFRAVCMRLRNAPFLVVAALNGHTLAGGLELAAACDLRFSSDKDRLMIGVPEMDLFGAVPSGGGGGQLLARLLGPAKALEFILEAKPVSPQKALEIGLVERLYAPDDLMPKTQEFAAEVAKKAGRLGVSAAKRQLLGGAELPLANAMELDRSVHWDNMRRGNFPKNVGAFVEKYGGDS